METEWTSAEKELPENRPPFPSVGSAALGCTRDRAWSEASQARGSVGVWQAPQPGRARPDPGPSFTKSPTGSRPLWASMETAGPGDCATRPGRCVTVWLQPGATCQETPLPQEPPSVPGGRGQTLSSAWESKLEFWPHSGSGSLGHLHHRRNAGAYWEPHRENP